MSSEIDCPVCDRKVQATTEVCPECGSDLNMADFDDLVEVANNIANGGPKVEPSINNMGAPAREEKGPEARQESHPPEVASEPPANSNGTSAVSAPEEQKEEDKRGFGRLFGKKKK